MQGRHPGSEQLHAPECLVVDAGAVGASAPELRWGLDGTSVALVDVVDGRWWPWFDDHSASIAAIGCLIAALVALRSIVRLARMPRVKGRAYCRRCNHDLDGGSVGEPCPECGCIQRGRERAGEPWRRPDALALVVAMLMMALGAGRVMTRVQWTNRLATGGRAWPLEALGSVEGWPLWKAWERSHLQRRAITIRQDATGSWHAGPPVPLPQGWWELSHDGRWIVGLRFEAGSNYIPTLEWFESSTGEPRAMVLGTNADGFFRPCGFTPDGRIVVGLVGLAVDSDPRMSPESPAALRVELIDPVAATRSVIGTATVTATSSGSGWLLPNVVVAAGDGPTPAWGIAAVRQGGLDRIRDLWSGSGESSKRGDDPLAPVPSIAGMHSARLVDDGGALEYRSDAWMGRAEIRRRIDLVSGIVLDGEANHARKDPESGIVMVPSPDGRWSAGVVGRDGRLEVVLRKPAP